MSVQKHLTLNNGTTIPSIGFGTFQARPDEVRRAVEIALRAGYRHLDCASIYGNEKEVGTGLRESGVDRKDVFVTSKLWNNQHRPEDVEKALDSTLENLGTGYVDLYLIHWPVVFQSGANTMPLDEHGSFVLDTIPIAQTWAAMEKLVASGKAKAIGVSNFNIRRLDELLSICKIVLAVNQIEAHPYLQQPALLEYCKSRGIVVQAYSPLGNNEIGAPRVIDDPFIKELGAKENLDVGQMLVSWAVQRGTVVLPKSVTEERIVSDLQAARLSEETFAAISALEKHGRYNFPGRWGYKVFDELSDEEVRKFADSYKSDNLKLFAGPIVA